MASTSTIQTSSSLPSSSTPSDKYRGAVVEDLQLPPAFALPIDEAISGAIEMAYDRDFSHFPVLDRSRRPVGYVDVAKLKRSFENRTANTHDPVSKFMTRFQRTSAQPYTVITPLTPLGELEEFLKDAIFALVTDYDRKFVLAVATSQDLENFVTRRGI